MERKKFSNSVKEDFMTRTPYRPKYVKNLLKILKCKRSIKNFCRDYRKVQDKIESQLDILHLIRQSRMAAMAYKAILKSDQGRFCAQLA